MTDKPVMEWINATPITHDDLLHVVETGATYHRAHPDAADMAVGMLLVTDYATAIYGKRNAFKFAAAMFYRMRALSELVRGGYLPGWTLPEGPDGGVMTQETVFRAAAEHPLIEQDGVIAFDPPSFLDRVLRLAPPEGRG